MMVMGLMGMDEVLTVKLKRIISVLENLRIVRLGFLKRLFLFRLLELLSLLQLVLVKFNVFIMFRNFSTGYPFVILRSKLIIIMDDGEYFTASVLFSNDDTLLPKNNFISF